MEATNTLEAPEAVVPAHTPDAHDHHDGHEAAGAHPEAGHEAQQHVHVVIMHLQTDELAKVLAALNTKDPVAEDEHTAQPENKEEEKTAAETPVTMAA